MSIFSGLDYWNGLLEHWNGLLEYWNGYLSHEMLIRGGEAGHGPARNLVLQLLK